MESKFIHQLADVKANCIGRNTRIWQYAVILSDALIGDDCNICAHVLIEGDVVIGNRVTVKSGTQLWDGLRVADDVFIGPNTTFANDNFPRSKHRPDNFLITQLHAGCSIGAGATILPGIEIGAHAMVGAGAVVTRSVPANAIVVGNPARIVGYVNASQPPMTENNSVNAPDIVNTKVSGVTLHKLPKIVDIRGSLTVGEIGKNIPFSVNRYFMVFDVPSIETRGEHAHYECHQFLICVCGSCAVVADDGKNRQEFQLDCPDLGIHLPPMTWGIQYKYSSDAVLLVLASHVYSNSDYIRNYDEFIKLTDIAK